MNPVMAERDGSETVFLFAFFRESMTKWRYFFLPERLVSGVVEQTWDVGQDAG
ncbi:hypothetical protein EJB05_52509 [Eragrostis curvula]|uniref:Uncharacterized protein n=1 Tax=Eragrostis curvula TaxID=38414 RepID=A0A5J9SSS3_9POAL|nr:hypothetical protein EJB05_54548 [Eragrostis curvula]TVU01974.1 hypothetical protein EJB05_52509 [Eragrostis curvula]